MLHITDVSNKDIQMIKPSGKKGHQFFWWACVKIQDKERFKLMEKNLGKYHQMDGKPIRVMPFDLYAKGPNGMSKVLRYNTCLTFKVADQAKVCLKDYEWLKKHFSEKFNIVSFKISMDKDHSVRGHVYMSFCLKSEMDKCLSCF